MDFEPFGEKPLADLQEEDLVALKSVSEGWYVEYKREALKPDAIAKSISAMANTYGGWVFYGIDEAGPNEVAGSFPGIAESDLESCLARIRDAVAGLINPSPHFEVKAVLSSSSVLLKPAHAVIVVRVPRSWNTPHLHQSGRVFRRIGSSSAPTHETDRTQLDELFRRRRTLEKKYERLFKDRITVPTDQRGSPSLRLFIVTDLWDERGIWLNGEAADVKAIMGETKGEVASCPFDTVAHSFAGFIARQRSNNPVTALTTTWELRKDLISDIFIPLTYIRADHWAPLLTYLHGYQFSHRFIESLGHQEGQTIGVLDANFLFATICGIANIQHALMERVGYKGTYWYKAEILNADGFTVFLDCENLIEHYEQHSAPVCMRRKIVIPSGHGMRHFMETWGEAAKGGRLSPVLESALSIFTNLARTMGLPDWIEAGPNTRDNYFQQLCSAAVRYQKIRNGS